MVPIATAIRPKKRTFPSVADLTGRYITNRAAVNITNRSASPLIKR